MTSTLVKVIIVPNSQVDMAVMTHSTREEYMTTDTNELNTAEAPEVLAAPTEVTPQSDAISETPDALAANKSEREVELEQQLADAEQRYKSAEGRLKSRDVSPALEDRLASIESQVKQSNREQRRRYYNDDDLDLDPQVRSEALSQIDAEERQEAGMQQTMTYARRWAGKLNDRLSKAGLTEDNAKVRDAMAKWESAATMDEIDDVVDEIDDLVTAELAALAKAAQDNARKEVEEARQKFNQDTGSLDVGANSAGVGQSGTQSPIEIWASYGRGEINFDKRVEEAGRSLGML